jgi:hypothetical protein
VCICVRLRARSGVCAPDVRACVCACARVARPVRASVRALHDCGRVWLGCARTARGSHGRRATGRRSSAGIARCAARLSTKRRCLRAVLPVALRDTAKTTRTHSSHFARTHAYAHTHTHARTHARTHASAHTYARTHARPQARAHAYTHTCRASGEHESGRGVLRAVGGQRGRLDPVVRDKVARQPHLHARAAAACTEATRPRRRTRSDVGVGS